MPNDSWCHASNSQQSEEKRKSWVGIFIIKHQVTSILGSPANMQARRALQKNGTGRGGISAIKFAIFSHYSLLWIMVVDILLYPLDCMFGKAYLFNHF